VTKYLRTHKLLRGRKKSEVEGVIEGRESFVQTPREEENEVTKLLVKV